MSRDETENTTKIKLTIYLINKKTFLWHIEIFILNTSNKRICLKLQKYLEKNLKKRKKVRKFRMIFVFIWLVLHFKNICNRFKAFV